MNWANTLNKPIFLVAISSIMVLFGFSFSDSLIPEADAYILKYLFGESRPDRTTYDYYMRTWGYIDPGYYDDPEFRYMTCKEGDSIVNGAIYAPNMNRGHIQIRDQGSGVDSETGLYKYDVAMYSYVQNDSDYRTYYYKYIYCKHN